MLIRDALREGPFNLRDLAEEMGGSYGTLREWSRGARTPKGENVRELAEAFDRRAQRLMEWAERMRRAASEE